MIDPVHILEDSTQQIAGGKLSVEICELERNAYRIMGRSIQKMRFRFKQYTEDITGIYDVLNRMVTGDFT